MFGRYTQLYELFRGSFKLAWHRVVGGMEVLSAMEAVETDEEDRPCEEIKICRTSVFVDPFKEAEEEV